MRTRTLVLYALLALGSAACGLKTGQKGVAPSAAKSYPGAKVVMETTDGAMRLRLYDQTPLHRDNFARLCEEGYYNGVIFHRVIKGFMIQSGDPDSKEARPNAMYGAGGPGYEIPAEIHPQLFHKKGALAAARTENPGRKSSGSQFYIVQGRMYDMEELFQIEARKQAKDPGFTYSPEAIEAYTTIGGAPHLDGEYTVFGEVEQGMEVIDSIANRATARADRPMTDVVIKSMRLAN